MLSKLGPHHPLLPHTAPVGRRPVPAAHAGTFPPCITAVLLYYSNNVLPEPLQQAVRPRPPVDRAMLLARTAHAWAGGRTGERGKQDKHSGRINSATGTDLWRKDQSLKRAIKRANESTFICLNICTGI